MNIHPIGPAERSRSSVRWKGALLVCAEATIGYAYWKFAIPVHRLEIRSELIMLGDLDQDRKWTADDLKTLDGFLHEPWAVPDDIVVRLNLNQNGLIDEEDTAILRSLVACGGDPYAAEEKANADVKPFPRPRELYRYVPTADYRPRPMWAHPYAGAARSPLRYLRQWRQSFKAGKRDCRAVLALVSASIKTDLGLSYDFERLGKPRSLTNLENYVQRAEWQYYKSTVREHDFRALIGYAQHDPRYLRAVSRTQRKLHDPTVRNHNLPTVLLFREALRIKGKDKKQTVGLLDEAIRIPYAGIRSLPREALPSSLALDNFLLPGNKEDSADKSRHGNVFGGIGLYRPPNEALDLALKREMQDLRDEAYSEAAMREFFRDLIPNLNGMYHVIAVNPHLLTNGAHAVRIIPVHGAIRHGLLL